MLHMHHFSPQHHCVCVDDDDDDGDEYDDGDGHVDGDDDADIMQILLSGMPRPCSGAM